MPQELTIALSAAAERIAASPGFRRPKSVELVAGGRMPLNITRTHYLAFQTLGLIEYVIEGAVAEVRLTSRGVEASRTWREVCKGSYNDAHIWHVPLGSRELVRVTRVAPLPAGVARVEFVWRWAPLPAGEAMGLSTASFPCVARVERAGGEWRVMENGPDGMRASLRRSEWSQ